MRSKGGSVIARSRARRLYGPGARTFHGFLAAVGCWPAGVENKKGRQPRRPSQRGKRPKRDVFSEQLLCHLKMDHSRIQSGPLTPIGPAPGGDVGELGSRRRRCGDDPGITWRELGGPPIAAPVQSGYGSSLIRDLIPHELGGTVDLIFPSTAPAAKLRFPSSEGKILERRGERAALGIWS